jgi:hypothetical protein
VFRHYTYIVYISISMLIWNVISVKRYINTRKRYIPAYRKVVIQTCVRERWLMTNQNTMFIFAVENTTRCYELFLHWCRKHANPRIKNWDKASPVLYQIHIKNFIFYDTVLYTFCLSCRKIILINRWLYFILNNKIIQLHLVFPLLTLGNMLGKYGHNLC